MTTGSGIALASCIAGFVAVAIFAPNVLAGAAVVALIGLALASL